ncbi:hypothetical protein ACFSTA_02915 [Ornithinibacillus salinisoli]|uniref:AP2-like integrase N-terminal domain-containing protein n=1 Tax=Ornithinibacillus salinisoli TaxID=1848459 RepID=A0ABW4VXC0_9BACI
MPYKGKDQYKVVTGKYKNKTGGLEFGYEYSSGNRTKSRQLAKQENNKRK